MPAHRLTPEQLAALLDDPWDGTGPLRIATDLAPEEVEPFFGAHNAALLLQVLLEEGSARLTAEGDLPRRLVLELMRRLRWDTGHLESLRKGQGWAPTEDDLGPMRETRRALQALRLIERDGDAILVAKAGRRLAEPERLGELHAALFRERFRLARNCPYFTNERMGGPTLRRIAPYMLWRISHRGARWTIVQALAPTLVTTDMLRRWGEVAAVPLWHALDIFVLPLLCDFGVLAMKPLGPGPPGLTPHSYRPGPLARRMLSWRFEETS